MDTDALANGGRDIWIRNCFEQQHEWTWKLKLNQQILQITNKLFLN